MPWTVEIPPPFKHQEETTTFIYSNRDVLIFSDPGTGKTRSVLDAIARFRKEGIGPALVFAPRVILEPAWLADARKFTPGLKLSIATAKNRAAAFKADADVYVTNHDAAKWVNENIKALPKFGMLILDESTAFKNRTALRSKAIARIAKNIDIRILMTGTPMPNGILDIWHQAYLADGGERLGRSFFAFRSVVCEPRQVGPRPEMVDWIDKPEAVDAVADLLSDITVRHRLEDCIDMPPNQVNTIDVDLPAKLRKQYDEMVRESVVQLERGEITAVNAAARMAKLLQIASGAVYDGSGSYVVLDKERYELIAELIDQRAQCLVAFLWRHQRDQLAHILKENGVAFATIDGETSAKDAPRIVEEFQSGRLKVILAHPQSASHGLTLTKGTTTIWASPTFDAERFEQFNRRIYRAGQTQRTETILVQARDTVDALAYARLQGKLDKQGGLLNLMKSLINSTKEAA